MGRRTWIKLFCDRWLRGTLREETLEVRGLWADLLALAGDSNYGDAGTIQVTPGMGFTDDQIAALFNIPLEKWIAGKSRLFETGRLKICPINVIQIEKWKSYQSEYDRQKQYRKGEKGQQKVQDKVQREVTTESYNPKLQQKLPGEERREKREEEEDLLSLKKEAKNLLEPSDSIPRKEIKPPGDPRLKNLIDYYHDGYFRRQGKKPLISGGDAPNLKRLLNLIDKEGNLEKSETEIKDLLDKFLDLPADSFEAKRGYSIGAFYSSFNALRLNTHGKIDRRAPSSKYREEDWG